MKPIASASRTRFRPAFQNSFCDRFRRRVRSIHRHGHGGVLRDIVPNATRGAQPCGPDAPSQSCFSSVCWGDRDAVPTMRPCNRDKAWCMSKVVMTANAESTTRSGKPPPPRFMQDCRPKRNNDDNKGGCRDNCKCWRVPVRLAWALTHPTSVGCFMQAHPPTSNLTSKKPDGQAAMANLLRAFSTWRTGTSRCCRDASSVNFLR